MSIFKLSALSGAVCASLYLATGNVHAADPNLDLLNADPFFYTADQTIPPDQEKMMGATGRPETTHSLIPHLPFYLGYMQTNFTYRFVNVVEQVFTMIGEGKHGLWRMQEAGTIREYLRSGQPALPEGADLNDPANLAIITSSYSSYERPEDWAFYRYPDQRVSDGKLNYIDLPINHAKYGGKYGRHEPIELPSFYCTMSENDYPHAVEAMTFAFDQPGANKVGPLGKRAGLDIKENYTNVLRLDHFPDARGWVNVGKKGYDSSYLNWQPIDTRKTRAEYYLVERPFFNHPYLFLLAVYDNEDNHDFRYVRPYGEYYKSLRERGLHHKLKTNVTQKPRFYIATKHGPRLERVIGTPLYGVHHPDRASFGGGGACPLKGGDWGRYPDTSGGSAWPTQYEEITPLCDGVLLDIKFYSNLDGRNWNDPGKYLANAGKGTKDVSYHVQPGNYGTFTDPYLVKRGVKNPDARYVPEYLTMHYPTVRAPVSYVSSPTSPVMRSSSGMTPAGTSCKPIMSATSQN